MAKNLRKAMVYWGNPLYKSKPPKTFIFRGFRRLCYGPASDKPNYDRDDGENQKEVYPASEGVRGNEPQNPEDEEDDKQCFEHSCYELTFSTGATFASGGRPLPFWGRRDLSARSAGFRQSDGDGLFRVLHFFPTPSDAQPAALQLAHFFPNLLL